MKNNKLTLALATTLTLASVGAHASDTSTYIAYKSQRGTTSVIPESRVIQLCGDIDGCTVRLAMYNWDGQGRTASRETLFYYNEKNRNWRASGGDNQGSNDNNRTEHIASAWSCYFTDGNYSQWTNHNDSNTNFGVLSWDNYNADCRVTLID